ncbi:hypothetical protein [Nitrosomonas marina]|uniref:Uncharacterized protein n=1 Tax=Nitrosomonas marina TaxID=917 RepID=A0A1H8G4C4_9PROT|nr:hypothetical protein [Nitrosomonas marina]SEN38615.1 hypothetical protein SAMN05216325_11620 [Nitrosomonas marina]
MSDVVAKTIMPKACGYCCVFLLIALLWPLSVQADLKEDIDRAIIKGNAADTSRTDHEKLFVYRCESIAKAIGFSETASGRATKYSCDQPGVGIALYAGSDLGDHSPESIGTYFKSELTKYGMNAQVFIQDNGNYGSSMGFYINGDSWLNEPVRPSRGVELIEALAAEAKLILFKRGRIQTLR